MYTFAHTYGPCGFPWWLGFSGGGGHPLSLLGVRASILFLLGSDAEPHQERRMAAATLSKRKGGPPPPKVDACPTHQKDAEDEHHQRLATQATGFATRRTCYQISHPVWSWELFATRCKRLARTEQCGTDVADGNKTGGSRLWVCSEGNQKQPRDRDGGYQMQEKRTRWPSISICMNGVAVRLQSMQII